MGLKFFNTNNSKSNIIGNKNLLFKMIIIIKLRKTITGSSRSNNNSFISNRMICSLYLFIVNSNNRVHSLNQKVIKLNLSSNRIHSLMKYLSKPYIPHRKLCSSKTLPIVALAPMDSGLLQRLILLLIMKVKISSMMKNVRES